MVLKEHGNYGYGTYSNQLPKDKTVRLSISSKVNQKTGTEKIGQAGNVNSYGKSWLRPVILHYISFSP